MNTSPTQILRLQLFGESHGELVGATLDGLPAGHELSMDVANRWLQERRASAWRDLGATAREETDEARLVSGFYRGKTTGTPLTVFFEQHAQRPKDYPAEEWLPRPSHADWTQWLQSDGAADLRGGGHHSGRITAPWVFCGGICAEILQQAGINIEAELIRIGELDCRKDDHAAITACSAADQSKIRSYLQDLAAKGDSCGALIEARVLGLPSGLGEPHFGGVEPLLGALLFAIPAVKRVSFGDGDSMLEQYGSVRNDGYLARGKLRSNHDGGAQGGITNGQVLLTRVAIKPTPSIALPQNSFDPRTGQSRLLKIHGRHDVCCGLRAVPVVKASLALGLLDLLLQRRGKDRKWDKTDGE